MAINKLVLLVFVIGITTLIAGVVVEAQDVKPCKEICYHAKYMTCPTTGNLKLKSVCNCCLAPEGECTLHFNDGNKIQCEKVDKICPLYVENAKYMTCSYTGNIHLKPASNCCFAPKGCSLHLNNGEIKNCGGNN